GRAVALATLPPTLLNNSKLMKKFTNLNQKAYFGKFGGQFVPETLMQALSELEQHYQRFKQDKTAQAQLAQLLRDYAGRPTPLYLAERLSQFLQCQVFLKREDLAHTGAH